MEDVLPFFRETQEAFTIYVVEQRFAVGRGLDYFKSFKGKVNYIDSNGAIQYLISKIQRWIRKNLPDVTELVTSSFSFANTYNITDAITILNKLFSVHEHQAVGPEVIDPIIIEEEKIDAKYITQIVTLHEKSVLQPVIIIVLRDNNFERAKALLANCPHGIHIKLIRNSGASEIYKVVNTGANDILAFVDAFAQQCFSTCSHTPRNILLNEQWAQNSIIKSYAPILLKCRSSLIRDEKSDVREELMRTTTLLSSALSSSGDDKKLLESLFCIAKLMTVFCNDAGNQDIAEAYQAARDVDDPLLLAQVYRYAYFLSEFPEEQQIDLLQQAENIFCSYNLEDQALYCKNNRLTYQFEQEKIHIQEFQTLQDEAIYNVPGLVGMSHILNNAGVAYLMTGNPEDSLSHFEKGLKYAQRQERSVQKIALMCNSLIARSYCYEEISEQELRILMNRIFDSMGIYQLPFIFSRFAMNVIACGFRQNRALGRDLLRQYPIEKLLTEAFQSNLMGSGSLILQIKYLTKRYPEFNLLEQVKLPKHYIDVYGIHRDYISRHGYNPFIFCTWL